MLMEKWVGQKLIIKLYSKFLVYEHIVIIKTSNLTMLAFKL